jgi:hypothetical protein
MVKTSDRFSENCTLARARKKKERKNSLDGNLARARARVRVPVLIAALRAAAGHFIFQRESRENHREIARKSAPS